MEHARPPPELNVEGSAAARADAWKKWWKQFAVFLKASGVNKEAKDVQASLLVNLIGAEGYEIFSTFTYAKDESADDIDCVKRKFDDHFGTKVNVTMLRFKFFTRTQNPGETINQYVTALKLLSQGCEFKHLEFGLIRDRVVCGISSNVVRDRLLRADGLTLAKAVQICEAHEMSTEEGRQIEQAQASTSSGIQVDSVGRARGARGRRGRGRRGGRGGRPPARGQRCPRCGSPHCDTAYCPAANVECYVCDMRGHYAKVCTKRAKAKGDEDDYAEISEDDGLYVNVLYVSSLEDQLKPIGKNVTKEWNERLYFKDSVS